ncbi:MAG: shikimate kinase [bacterium]
MKTFGLLGKKLGHSFSPYVHHAFSNTEYQLFETDDLASFIKNASFAGVNVTLPYKETVIPFLDILDDVAAATGSVNTIVRKDGKSYGYNTDYDGIRATFVRAGVAPKGKKVAVLGNGGTAKTVIRYLQDAGAAEIDVYCRHPRRPGETLLTAAGGDHDILVSATSAGMYPDDDVLPIVDLDRFPSLAFVFDLIFNPLRTHLILAAIARGIPAVSGLYMLVMQAARSHELFTGNAVAESTAMQVYLELYKKEANIVFIGMPLSGKSMYAGIIARKMGKSAFDTDDEIEQRQGMTIPDIFSVKGEAVFRAMEDDLITTIRHMRGLVVSTGGGMILNPDAMARLRHNGIVVFLDKDYHRIMNVPIRNRPLIQTPEDVERLALARRPLYEAYADVTVEITGRRDDAIQEIEAKLDAYFNR